MANRYRLRYDFWLNVNDTAQEKIADTIEVLKNNRLFSKTIRDGIRLVCDLRKGSLDVLFELFPYVKSEFLKYVQDVVGIAVSESDITRVHDKYQHDQYLKDMIALQNEQIDRLTKELEKTRGSASNDFEGILRKIVREENERLSNNAPQSPVSGLQPTNVQSNGIGLKGLSGGNTFTPPPLDNDDEDMPAIELKRDTSGQATKNFLASMNALQGK